MTCCAKFGGTAAMTSWVKSLTEKFAHWPWEPFAVEFEAQNANHFVSHFNSRQQCEVDNYS